LSAGSAQWRRCRDEDGCSSDCGAQATSLQFAAACRKHINEVYAAKVTMFRSGKLPDRAGWQPALPRNLMSATIGRPLTRVDGRLKVTGAATYAAEFARPKLA